MSTSAMVALTATAVIAAVIGVGAITSYHQRKRSQAETAAREQAEEARREYKALRIMAPDLPVRTPPSPPRQRTKVTRLYGTLLLLGSALAALWDFARQQPIATALVSAAIVGALSLPIVAFEGDGGAAPPVASPPTQTTTVTVPATTTTPTTTGRGAPSESSVTTTTGGTATTPPQEIAPAVDTIGHAPPSRTKPHSRAPRAHTTPPATTTQSSPPGNSPPPSGGGPPHGQHCLLRLPLDPLVDVKLLCG